MKKLALILICASISTSIVAMEHQPRTETAQSSRGQPEYSSFNYDTYVITDLPESVVIQEVYLPKNPPYAVLNVKISTAPEIIKGNRKVRDVDLERSNKYSNNTDKRSILNNKTVRLPRGAIRCEYLIC